MPLDNCPVCGKPTFGKADVPMGGGGAGMNLYIHTISSRRQTDKEVLQEMLLDLDERIDDDDSDESWADSQFRSGLEDAILYAPTERDENEEFLLVSGCGEDKDNK